MCSSAVKHSVLCQLSCLLIVVHIFYSLLIFVYFYQLWKQCAKISYYEIDMSILLVLSIFALYT